MTVLPFQCHLKSWTEGGGILLVCSPNVSVYVLSQDTVPYSFGYIFSLSKAQQIYYLSLLIELNALILCTGQEECPEAEAS